MARELGVEVVNRDRTQDEWDTYVEPGGQVMSACT
jgi:hypothetical protein